MAEQKHGQKSSKVDPAIHTFDLSKYSLNVKTVIRNAAIATYYEQALRYEDDTAISSTGALMAYSGTKTGRSPSDKRIVETVDEAKDVFWGKINIKLQQSSFDINKERAIDFLNLQKRLYVVDAYAGWDIPTRLKIRVICASAYHALFMRNMLIRPTEDELANFGEPDIVVFNAGFIGANSHTTGMTSKSSVDLNLHTREMVILGTMYAGEMKKGVFTFMHYYMPKKGYLSLHSSANQGPKGDVSLFFGLSGTGKTTLSADPRRSLIGDDEHVWNDQGIFNIEGGCYAKAEHLSAETEPEIFGAIRFGAVLENVVYDPISREVDYNDMSITENTRVCYPIEYIPNSLVPCKGGHPKNIILLTCDAFGVLPPVSKLTPNQTSYHFISGYTAKVAGTEVGIKEPQTTFSACFGEAFIVWHPAVYADLLAKKMAEHNADAWLLNTGWIGGGYGEGSRIKLRYTRAMLDAIHDGSLAQAPTVNFPLFNLQVPTKCANVPDEILVPRNTWKDSAKYDETLRKLAAAFNKNFEKYQAGVPKDVIEAGPKLQ